MLLETWEKENLLVGVICRVLHVRGISGLPNLPTSIRASKVRP